MKEPIDHGEFEDRIEGLQGHCAADGKKWPCKTWRKWTKSKDYRIQELEAKAVRVALDAAGNRRELEGLREAHRRLELLIRGGVVLALRDSGANISETVEVDYHEHTSTGGHVFQSTGMQEYRVEYTGKNARYVNGRMEESWE